MFLIITLLLIIIIKNYNNELIDLHQNLSTEQLWNEIDAVLALMKMNKTLGQLIPIATEDFTRPLNEITDCYAFEVIDNNTNETTFINIFDKTRRFNDVVKFYYQAFPKNDISADSIRALLSSVREIVARCMIQDNRQFTSSNENEKTMKFGFTELSDKNYNYMRKMLGLITDERLIPSYNYNNYWLYPSTTRAVYDGSSPYCLRMSANLPDKFDWRDKNVVTKVKNQGFCGSCWAIAATDSLESAYLINSNLTKDQLNLSEQELISCSRINGCQGGNAILAFDFIKRYGITSEQMMPHQANDNNNICPYIPQPIGGIRGYCLRSEIRYKNSISSEYLTDDDIRHALVSYGPLYISINADRLSRNYRAGIIDDKTCSMQVNHAVLLVGYTPNEWILKNSWGNTWGEDGFFRLSRGQNMCGINTEIAYPLVV